MNLKRFLLAGLAAFGAVFVSDMIFHGNLLMGLYEKTASVWRPKAEANQLMGLMMLTQVLFAFAFTRLYIGGYESGKAGLGQGLRFGFYAALLVGPLQSLVWYVVLPIPAVLAVGWFVSALVSCLGAGAAVGSVYRKGA